LSAFADNQEANAEIMDALEQMKEGKYKAAASDFLDAELYADDTFLKAKAVRFAAECYRKSGHKYKEFKCLEKLINSYPTHVEYSKAVDREFELGDEFYAGSRDPRFDWIPWWDDQDRTIKIYEIALKHGPFAKRAPEARLRLGRLYIDEQKIDKALKTLRETVKMYPKTNIQKYAYFELASLLVQLSRHGDGDGKYGNEAREVLKLIKEKYPTSREIGWVEQALLESDDITAKRLYGIARFYNRIGRTEPAVRYLNDVIQDYPDANVTEDSEALLASIDSEYKPPLEKKTKPLKYQLYTREKIPLQAEPIMIVPENSDGKWLLPIRDLELGEIKKERQEKENKNE
jgi:outer membrane protein assembly factor BamD (BamD/ComL family)